MAGEKIRSLQILRCAAALMVAGYHARGFSGVSSAIDPGRLDGLGAAGVDIFFVLSGAIIWRSAFFGRRVSAGDFLRKRFLRVAPVYYVVTLLSFPLFLAIDWDHDLASIATSIFFWPAWGGKYTWPVDGVGWTLSFEMLFYVGAAAVLRSRYFLPVLAIGFASGWHLRDTLGWPVFEFTGNPIILEFTIGVAVAAFWQERHAPLWCGASIAILGAALITLLCLPPQLIDPRQLLQGALAIWRVVLWGIPAAILLLGCLMIEPHIKGRWVGVPVFLGDASYSIYLVHWPVMVACSKLFNGTAPPELLALFYFVAAVVLSILFYQFVERPVTRGHRGSTKFPDDDRTLALRLREPKGHPAPPIERAPSANDASR